MANEEKRSWIMLVVSVIAYATYVVIVLGRAGPTPLADVSYAPALLWSIGLAVATQIVINIAIGIASPAQAKKKDQRDREIHRLGEYVGQSFVVVGGVSALLMAMTETDYFWIANVIYLTFTLSAVLGAVAKIFAYRRGFQTW
jgi:hypothetical protein